MYSLSRLPDLFYNQVLETPEVFLNNHIELKFDLFFEGALTFNLPQTHQEFTEYQECGCCGCGHDAIKKSFAFGITDLSANPMSTTQTLFMDSVAGDSSTTAILTIGSSVTGTRETGTDADWFQVSLEAGTSYTFHMVREGTDNEHADPLMQLIDTDGVTILQTNDDITSGQQNSKITFEATTTGTYYISAEGWQTSTGDYRLYADVGSSRQEATLDVFSDWLTDGFSPGTKWNKTALTYDVSKLPAEGQAIAILAFQAWADVSGLTFTSVAEGETADISFQEVDPDTNAADPDSGAFARSSTSNGQIISSLIHVDADWSTNTDGSNNYALNSYRYQTYLHEIGHALGLGHGGPYNGDSTFGTDNLFANDSWSYTVMSYHDQGEVNSGTPRLVLGLQLVDIIAIQNLYGAATSTRGGNSVYGFNSTETDVFNFETTFSNNGIRPPSLSIYDTDGIDTLDFSGYSAHQTISLVQETFSSIGDNTNTSDTTDALQNLISIARGTVIENAIGGSGSDTITGNSSDNVLTGGAGDDTIDGAGGTDYVNYTTGSLSDYNITDNGDGTFTITSTAYGTDTVNNVEFIRINGVDQELGSTNPNPGPISTESTENDDNLTGTSGDDIINALGGNDTINAQEGNDTIDGGDGTDTLIIERASTNSTIIKFSHGPTYIFDNNSTERDAISNIETIQFTDTSVSLESVNSVEIYSYIASNTDLINAFGTNITKATNHYIKSGFYEGRSLDNFDQISYLASHGDLLGAFGSDGDAATRHYIQSGFSEGRSLDNFDELSYLASNTDLLGVIGNNKDASTLHYVQSGFSEGRPTDNFNDLLYIASNADLLVAFGTNEDAGLSHYVKNGFSEGRTIDSFDAGQYLDNHADLRAAFGTDLDAAILHYIKNGYFEGRTDQSSSSSNSEAFDFTDFDESEASPLQELAKDMNAGHYTPEMDSDLTDFISVEFDDFYFL